MRPRSGGGVKRPKLTHLSELGVGGYVGSGSRPKNPVLGFGIDLRPIPGWDAVGRALQPVQGANFGSRGMATGAQSEFPSGRWIARARSARRGHGTIRQSANSSMRGFGRW